MFWARLLVLSVARYKCAPFVVAACALIGYFSTYYVWLPWSIQPGLCAAGYVYLGYLFRENDVFNHLDKGHLLACGLIWIASLLDGTALDMASCTYGRSAVDILAATLLGAPRFRRLLTLSRTS